MASQRLDADLQTVREVQVHIPLHIDVSDAETVRVILQPTNGRARTVVIPAHQFEEYR